LSYSRCNYRITHYESHRAFLKPLAGTTVTLGCRWDFMKNTDLKLQYEHISLDPGSSGLLINLQPGYRTGSSFNVISATVDWVF